MWHGQLIPKRNILSCRLNCLLATEMVDCSTPVDRLHRNCCHQRGCVYVGPWTSTTRPVSCQSLDEQGTIDTMLSLSQIEFLPGQQHVHCIFLSDLVNFSRSRCRSKAEWLDRLCCDSRSMCEGKAPCYDSPSGSIHTHVHT